MSGPRALLRQIALFVSSIGRRITAVRPGAARLRNQEQALTQLHRHTSNMFENLSKSSEKVNFKSAWLPGGGFTSSSRSGDFDVDLFLLSADFRQLARAGGAALTSYAQLFAEHVQHLSDDELRRCLIAARSPEAQDKQYKHTLGDERRLDGELDKVRALMELETSIATEMIRRIDRVIEASVQRTFDAIDAGEPPERIAEHAHFVFDSAVPLVKAGVIAEDEMNREALDDAVLKHLDKLPQEQLNALLQHLPAEDLLRLRGDGKSQPKQANAKVTSRLASCWGRQVTQRTDAKVMNALAREIVARPGRLAADVVREAKDFYARFDGETPVDRTAFLQHTARLATAVRVLKNHCATFRLPNPVSRGSSESFETLARATARAEAALASGRVRVDQLTPAEVSALARTLDTLDAGDVSQTLLGDAQRAHLETRREDFRRQLMNTLDAFATKQGPKELLRNLSALEHSSRALQDVAAKPVETDLITECIQQLTDGQRTAITASLEDVHSQALGSALHVGASLAFDARDTATGNRLSHTARLLDDIASHADNRMTTQPPDAGAMLLKHRRLAAGFLSEEARHALRNVYGLSVPKSGTGAPRSPFWQLNQSSPTLQAGTFTQAQTAHMRKIFEGSPTRQESERQVIGPYHVGNGFYHDAMRKFEYRIVMPATTAVAPDTGATASEPMIDVRNWPVVGDENAMKAEKHARLIAGYEKLIALCGGNEAQAQSLTTYAHQSIMAGFLATCADKNGPLSLPDGSHPGSVLLASESTGGHYTSTVTFSIGANGRPRIDVDYRLSGRFAFLNEGEGTKRYVMPDSHIAGHFCGELTEDGKLTLLEPPSYSFDLRLDSSQADYFAPSVESIGEAEEDSDTLRDILTFSRNVGAEDAVRGLRALNRFENDPSLMRASEVVAVCNDHAVDSEIDSAAVDWLSSATRTALNRELQLAGGGLAAAFDQVVAHARRVSKEQTQKADTTEISLQQQVATFEQALEELALGGVDVFNQAENLYEEFATFMSSHPARAHEVPELGRDPMTVVRERLDSQCNRPLAPQLFGNLRQRLSDRIEQHLLPRLIKIASTG